MKSIAIVGLNFGRHIIDSLLQAPARNYFKIAAVCDLDRAKAEAMAARLQCAAFTSLDSLLKVPSIPVIGLYTGPSGRAALLRKIIRSGKDVMTTKPFELDARAGLAILREARRRHRTIFLNSPAPVASPDLAQIARWVKEFNLGRPVGARADTWASYHEKADGSWYDDTARCPVAPIFRIGIYLINDLLRLWGEAATVQVIHSRLRTRRPTPDNAQLAIRFKNGAIGSVYASFCIDDHQPYRNTLALHYEQGSIYRNLPPQPGPPGSPEIPTVLTLVARRKNGKAVVRRRVFPAYSHGDYRWDLLHRVIDGKKLGDLDLVSPEQVVAGIKVIAAMARAEKSGGTEKV